MLLRVCYFYGSRIFYLNVDDGSKCSKEIVVFIVLKSLCSFHESNPVQKEVLECGHLTVPNFLFLVFLVLCFFFV